MQHRAMEMTLGDTSGDGHSVYQSIILNLKGDDLSDAALKDAYQKTRDEVGLELFNPYTNNRGTVFDSDDIMRTGVIGHLMNLGYSLETRDLSQEGIFCFGVPDAEYKQLSVELDKLKKNNPNKIYYTSMIGLAMWWVGRNIPNFDWDVEPVKKVDSLIGGHGSVFNAGYGYSTMRPY